MTPPRVNPENFIGLALVINRLRDGPTFVFHYPPNVQTGHNSSCHDVDEPPNHGDLLMERLSGREGPAEHPGSQGDHLGMNSNHQSAPWDHVAGFPTNDLASILTPGRPFHKRLFQLFLDPLCCISYPIHVPESGKWKKRKKPHKPKPTSSDNLVVSENAKLEAKDGVVDPVKGKEGSRTYPDDAEDKPSSMNMFNLVFILNPKKHETDDLVETLYLNIVKKVNKALKYSQEHSDFVWKESKRILTLKEKGREDRRRMSSLWKEIVASSSLAASIQEMYEAVSQDKIATLQLETTGGTLTPWVQIPIPFYVSDIPQDAADEGLWLSTANTFVGDDAVDETGYWDKNFALLLMDDEKNIVSELQADPDPATLAMIEFVKLSRPTVSFYKLGQSSILSLSQVRRYAQHFIFWRRAIAIPPLHARDVYILSPNCNLSRLPRASVEWQRQFPHMASLPNFLAELSYAPRPYKHFAPAKTYRPLYLNMLAWLMRGGWVTQLCTFAYVVVWPEIVYEVDYQVEAEEIQRAAKEPSAFGASGPAYELFDDQSTNDHAHVPTMMEQAAEKARLERIADKARREALEKATAHARKVVPTATDHPSLNDSPHLLGMNPYIIPDAKKAAGKESLYLSAIGRRFEDDKVADAWKKVWRYFNGQSALERIALEEDIRRKEAWALLTAMSEYLLCVRHW